MELSAQVDQIVRAVQALEPTQHRQLIAISGPPAAGKTTLARAVRDALEVAGLPCGLVQMDGFHLSNEVLQSRGLQHRKGAPETFDLDGFTLLLQRLASSPDVSVPAFDRKRDCVVNDAGRIGLDQRHVVVEGNYLLLTDPGWEKLADLWTFSVFVAPERNVLRERLLQRWIDHGMTPEAAETRAESNDMANALLVLDRSNLGRVDLKLD